MNAGASQEAVRLRRDERLSAGLISLKTGIPCTTVRRLVATDPLTKAETLAARSEAAKRATSTRLTANPPKGTDREKQRRTWTRWWKNNKPKHLASVRKHEKKRRKTVREFLNEYKLNAGCKYCGYAEHPAALDFDHRPGEGKCFNVSIAPARGFSRKRLLAEIAKCDVVCANCHRVRTAERRQGIVAER